ncbi:OLC1v1023435C1 [Oldenlandia corymbosa var. corymbosa]|uniref:OLC1v1023435C1 n=1 Tax=Oldenlandia corymbosa var. corymbosa TaxID=529605 RepID=A0AAV1C2W3_OLDCO|nr:OLC1v1023435C1 [Oldenlandia corymbosa var. corymbosa]
MDKQRQYERVFNHFDEDGDGRISALELQNCIGSLIGAPMSMAECVAAVEMMDSDGDGLVSMEEFVRMVEGGGEEERVKELKEAFKMYEMDEGCGFIHPKSLKRMLSRLGESRSLGDCRNMIARFDLNGDGVLCFDEFKIMMSSSS